MQTDMTHKIKARLNITVGQDPKKPGKYFVLNADYNIFVAEWDGECFVIDYRPEDYRPIVGWCPLDSAAEISPLNERKLDEMLKLYGAFVTVRFQEAPDDD